MSFVTIDLTEILEAEKQWDRGLQIMSDGVRRAVKMAVEEGAREGINTRHYQDQTGLLTSRIRGFVEISTPGGAVGVLGAFTHYASYVDAGTRPHEIRGNPWLVFKTKDGQWVRTHLVRHPGTKADGFMGRAFLKAERVLLREVEVAAQQFERFMNE